MRIIWPVKDIAQRRHKEVWDPGDFQSAEDGHYKESLNV